MDQYDISIYFYPKLINIYKYFNINTLNELIELIIKETNIKINYDINHIEIINLINNTYKHPFFLTLKWIYEDTEPINVTKKNLYYIINNFYKKEETYIISKIYLYCYNKNSYNKNIYNKINLKYQFKIQFTSYIIDLLIGNNICIEIDENKHNNYNKEYEIDRNKLLSLLGYKVIHINPNIFYLNEKLILNFIDEIVSHYNNKINEVNKDDNIINYLNYVNDKKKQNIIKFNEYKYNSDHIWLY